ncbi:MAG: AAA family ATPase [FCB group bacterium]|jgi:ATP-dependent Clp protease ATP-binding subunit ClpB
MAEISNNDTTRKRLEEIEKELAKLGFEDLELKKRWQEEKKYIKQIREYKAGIESAKMRADEFERTGDYGKVAEIRYGTILELEKKLKEANAKLNEVQASGKMLKEEVDAEDIAEIVSKWTGIPLQNMLETERTKLLKIEDRIHQRLVDQEEAVTAVANAIRRSRAGLQDAKRPLGSFIFLGSTGVGKTEMARALAEFLFDDENALIRIDMSEYMEKFSVSRLIGAPPGYVGYEEGGQLTEAIRRKPYSVILLDEIEKASPDVFNLLLQVLDDGRLTDGKGRLVNFKNTIIIMTSNLGTEIIQDKILNITEENRDGIMSKLRSNIIDLLRKNMRPEFLNRIDEIILFKPLTASEIQKIAELQLNNLKDKFAKEGIKFEISPDALEWLAHIGFDAQFGARPLKRAIQKNIIDPLALKLLSSDYITGDTIIVDTSETGGFVFNKSSSS